MPQEEHPWVWLLLPCSRMEPTLQELLQPPSLCACCWLFISLAVKEGMELSAEVKAVSKLSDSFCS